MKTSRQALLKAKENLIGYLLQKAESEDWHGVADAAMDLREVDAKLEVLAELPNPVPADGWAKLNGPHDLQTARESHYDAKTDSYIFADGTPDLVRTSNQRYL